MQFTSFLSVLLVSISGFAADIWRPASSFTVGSPWGPLASDIPWGSWYANPGTNTLTIPIDIHIGTTLPPGDYAMAIYTVDYDYYFDTHFTAGGATATNYTSDRAVGSWDNGRWSDFVIIKPTSSFTNVSIVFSNATIAVGLKTAFGGLFITQKTNVLMLSNSKYVTLNYPSSNSWSSVSDGRNYIPNGSFEAGFRRGAAWYSSARTTGNMESWDPTVAYEGKASLKIVTTNSQFMQLLTAPILVPSNRVYTASFMAKSTGTNNGLVRIASTFTAPAGFSPTVNTQSVSVAIGTNWTRVSVTGRVLDYPFSEVNLLFQVTGGSGNSGPTTTWIDCVQLKDSSDTNYVSEAPIELGIWTGKIGNIYYSDSAPVVPVKLRNSTAGTISSSITVLAYDWQNTLILSNSLPYSLAAGETNAVLATLPIGKSGPIRVNAFDAVYGGLPDEAIISVVPRPKGTSQANARMGWHIIDANWILQVATNLGIQHVRRLSPGAYFRWSEAEKSPGVYTWYDDAINLANSYGLLTLGNLTQTLNTNFQSRTFFRMNNVSGVFSNTEMVSSAVATGYVARAMTSENFTGPALFLSNATPWSVSAGWSNTSGLLTGRVSGATASLTGLVYTTAVAMDRWSNFVSALADHYSTNVLNWEIGNEYKQETSYLFGDDGLYSEFLRDSILAIKSKQPAAKIVALGGPGGSSTNSARIVLDNIAAAGLSTNIDSISFHVYPSADEESPIAGKFSTDVGIPWINSESGATDYGAFTSWGSSQRRDGTPVESFNAADRYYLGGGYIASMVIRNHLTSIGNGARRVYTYDQRNYPPNHFDREYSGIEYDDTLKPVTTAVAVLANFTDDATVVGGAENNSTTNANCYTFDRGSNTVISVHARVASTNTATLLTCTLPVAFPPYVRHDMFGNPIGTNEASFKVGGYPFYLVTTNVAAQAHTNFAAATFSTATDTSAPSPMISLWPAVYARTNDQTIPLRWFAIDDRDKPETGLSADRLTYSRKLEPVETEFSAFSPITFDDLAGYTPGKYTLRIIAKDSTGNTSAPVAQTFWIGAPYGRSTGAVTRATVNSLRVLSFP